jgi:putative peptide zinc metalloprotease protein
MYVPQCNRFRRDLTITSHLPQDADGTALHYLVKDPLTGELFQFTEEEYFLCQSINGFTALQDIVQAFEAHFSSPLSVKHLLKFTKQLSTSGLLESIAEGEVESASPSIMPLPPKSRSLRPAQRRSRRAKKTVHYWVTLPFAEQVFSLLGLPLVLLHPFLGLGVGLLFVGVFIALFTLFQNFSLLLNDTSIYLKTIPYLSHLAFNLLLSSSIAKIAQAALFGSYGGKIQEFGLIFAFGFFPRFYLDRSNMRLLKRFEGLLVLATPLLIRLLLFVFGVFLWYNVRETNTQLVVIALLMIHVNLVDFLLDANPFWPADGYMWMLAYFQIPELYQQSIRLWDITVKGRPLPSSLSQSTKLKLKCFGFFALFSSVVLLLIVILIIAFGLGDNFASKLFGGGSDMVLFCGLSILLIRKLWFGWSKMHQNSQKNSDKLNIIVPKPGELSAPARNDILLFKDSTAALQRKAKPPRWTWGKSVQLVLQLAALGGIGWLLMLPYEFRPGGKFQLLSPRQQNIQAQVSGKLVRVFYRGGDNGWIKAGTPLAIVESTDLNNNFNETQEQIQRQKAAIREADARVDKLKVGAKTEEIELATQRIESAKSEVLATYKQVQSAIAQAKLSHQKLVRYESLFREGAYSQQEYEDQQRQADTDENQVATLIQELETKKQKEAEAIANLKLVKSGSYPEDIRAAQEAANVARAELGRLLQQSSYLKNEIRRTAITMPYHGRLVTPYLDQKIGSYVKQGDTFAVVSDNRDLLGELMVPEATIDQLKVNRSVEIKLQAYQGESFTGKVLAIEPSVNTDSSKGETQVSESSGNKVQISSEKAGRVVRVLVKVEDPRRLAKPGMTGYGKVEGQTMTIFQAFSRSMWRFISIEMWSWLP